MTDVGGSIGGRYRLDRRLARGGMGTVWQGWDERLHRPVAVKRLVVPPELTRAERDVAVKRAMREARITARLHHPNAVQVFDVVDDGDTPCLIMEYVPSRSLQEVLDEKGPIGPQEAARIGTQLAAALAAAHRAGIVHRDVKPGNVLIAEDGAVRITDFGISHAFDDITLTSAGMVSGTPAFLAPEVARGGASTYASDVYSLGATLYTAVEGRPPFGSDPNPMAVLHRVASGEPQPPTRSGPLTPIVTAMMSRDPAVRPSMVQVANSLVGLLTATHDAPTSSHTQVSTRQWPAPPVASRPPADTARLSPPPDGRPPQRTDNRKRSWLAIAAVLIVVALAATGGVLLLGRGGGSNHRAHGPTSSVPPATPATSARPSSPAGSAASAPPSTPAGSATSAAPPSAPTSAVQEGAPSDQDLTNAVVDYFNLVPGNLDAAWARLTPHFQTTKAQSRQNFDAFWNSIQRVDVSNPTGEAPDGVSATLTYHYKDGRVVTEQTQFRLVRQDGVLKIDQES